jgi:hypothetical protein
VKPRLTTFPGVEPESIRCGEHPKTQFAHGDDGYSEALGWLRRQRTVLLTLYEE